MFSLITSIAATLAIASAASDSINGAVNETVSITLDTNPSTGYGWMIQELPSELVYVYSSTVTNDCAAGESGCSSKSVLNFFANNAGEGTLKLVYGQTWNKDSWQEKDVSVHIE